MSKPGLDQLDRRTQRKVEYRDDVKAQRVVLLVLGVLLLVMGVIWFLQGVGVLGGSVMSGVTLWAIVGPVVAIVGGLLLFRARRV